MLFSPIKSKASFTAKWKPRAMQFCDIVGRDARRDFVSIRQTAPRTLLLLDSSILIFVSCCRLIRCAHDPSGFLWFSLQMKAYSTQILCTLCKETSFLQASWEWGHLLRQAPQLPHLAENLFELQYIDGCKFLTFQLRWN